MTEQARSKNEAAPKWKLPAWLTTDAEAICEMLAADFEHEKLSAGGPDDRPAFPPVNPQALRHALRFAASITARRGVTGEITSDTHGHAWLTLEMTIHAGNDDHHCEAIVIFSGDGIKYFETMESDAEFDTIDRLALVADAMRADGFVV